MKNLVRTFGLVITIMLLVACSMVIYTKDSKKEELASAVNEGVEETMMIFRDDSVEIKSNEEASKLLIANIAKRIDSKNNAVFKIHTIDADNGLIDVSVTIDYPLVISSGKATVRKTMLIEGIK